MQNIVSKKQFADFIGKSPKHVSNLIANNMPTLGGGGRGKVVQIDSKKALEWLIDYEISKRYGDEGVDESRLLTRARRYQIELDLEMKRKELGPISGFEEIGLRFANVYKSQILALPVRLAGKVASESDIDNVREILDDECRKILAATAEQFMEAIQALAEEADQIIFTDDSEDSESTA